MNILYENDRMVSITVSYVNMKRKLSRYAMHTILWKEYIYANMKWIYQSTPTFNRLMNFLHSDNIFFSWHFGDWNVLLDGSSPNPLTGNSQITWQLLFFLIKPRPAWTLTYFRYTNRLIAIRSDLVKYTTMIL